MFKPCDVNRRFLKSILWKNSQMLANCWIHWSLNVTQANMVLVLTRPWLSRLRPWWPRPWLIRPRLSKNEIECTRDQNLIVEDKFVEITPHILCTNQRSQHRIRISYDVMYKHYFTFFYQRHCILHRTINWSQIIQYHTYSNHTRWRVWRMPTMSKMDTRLHLLLQYLIQVQRQ